jgi:hypothetical protein
LKCNNLVWCFSQSNLVLLPQLSQIDRLAKVQITYFRERPLLNIIYG